MHYLHDVCVQRSFGVKQIVGRQITVAAFLSTVLDESFHKAGRKAVSLARIQIVLITVVYGSDIDTLTDRSHDLTGVKEHVFKTYKDSGIIGFEVLSIPVAPQIRQTIVSINKLIRRLRPLDSNFKFCGITENFVFAVFSAGDKIRAMAWNIGPICFIALLALRPEK